MLEANSASPVWLNVVLLGLPKAMLDPEVVDMFDSSNSEAVGPDVVKVDDLNNVDVGDVLGKLVLVVNFKSVLVRIDKVVRESVLLASFCDSSELGELVGVAELVKEIVLEIVALVLLFGKVMSFP